MAIGSDGTGWIPFEDYELARTIGIIALALILFEGGLTSGLVEIRPVLGTAVSLALIATPITAAIAGVTAALLFDTSTSRRACWSARCLASTDGAAIFALLRNSTLRRKLARALEGESGLNDPVAVLLVLALIEFINTPGYNFADALLLLVRQLGIGLAVGVAGRLARRSGVPAGAAGDRGAVPGRLARDRRARVRRRRHAARLGLPRRLPGRARARLGRDPRPADDHRVPPGARMGRAGRHVPRRSACSCSRTSSPTSAVEGTVLALVAAAVARPLAVFPATVFASFGKRERIVLGWAGLRGAVPVVLATFPVIAEVPGSRELFNIVFFAVLVSTVLQGTTFEPLAARLGVTTSEPALPAAAGRGRHDPPARRRDPRVPDRRRRRDRRPPRPRPRPPARRGRQRDRARRPGDPAARHHAPARRRPHPRPHPPGERARALRASATAGTPARSAARRARAPMPLGREAVFSTGALARARTATRRTPSASAGAR